MCQFSIGAIRDRAIVTKMDQAEQKIRLKFTKSGSGNILFKFVFMKFWIKSEDRTIFHPKFKPELPGWIKVDPKVGLKIS